MASSKDSRRRGTNPRPPAYEADALPLSYIGARAKRILQHMDRFRNDHGEIPFSSVDTDNTPS